MLLLQWISRSLLLLTFLLESIQDQRRIRTLSSTEELLKQSHVAEILNPQGLIVIIALTNLIGVFSFAALYFPKYNAALIYYIVFTHWHAILSFTSQPEDSSSDSTTQRLQLFSLFLILSDSLLREQKDKNHRSQVPYRAYSRVEYYTHN